MQGSASDRLSVLRRHLSQPEITSAGELLREDCAATQTILFARPAYDGASFAKAVPALHLSKDADVPGQDPGQLAAALPRPSFGRPVSSKTSGPQSNPRASRSAEQSQLHNDLPAFSRPEAINATEPMHPVWLSKEM
ncbi:hypothetical protein WJX84_005882 [Apatococcus fuscideae]|uniref:Uncharacterized protein n=1 Tax=Apatococcus fuscideae TaxID=2026836 RepID=A0AAW1TEI1_9CHLO